MHNGKSTFSNDIFSETRKELQELNFPHSDYQMTSSHAKQFSGGGHYGIELSSMNNPKILRDALKLAKSHQLDISRAIECRGIMRLPNAELKEMVDICEDNQIGLILSIGPRATNDTGGFARSENGKFVGYRLRGMENIVRADEAVKRDIEFGATGFLIYDEGLLYLLNKMRITGLIPAHVTFKYSVHACCSNPVSARFLQENGADTINIIPDLDINMIAAFRQAIEIPLDIFSDTAKAAGGFIRTYDVPEMIKYASPVYIKCGPISQPLQNHLPTAVELEERVKQAKNVQEHIERYLPEAKKVGLSEYTLAIPSSKTVHDSKSYASTAQVFDILPLQEVAA